MWWRRGLAVVMVGVLLVTMSPGVSVEGGARPPDGGAEGVGPGSQGGEEATELRTLYSRHFRTPTGLVAEIFPQPIHYRDGQAYLPVENDIVPAGPGEGPADVPGQAFAYRNEANTFRTWFSASPTGNRVRLEEGGSWIEFDLDEDGLPAPAGSASTVTDAVYGDDEGGGAAGPGTGPGGGCRAEFRVERRGNGLAYRDRWGRIDYAYRVTSTSLKETVVLYGPGKTRLCFGLRTHGLEVRAGPNGAIDFVARKDKDGGAGDAPQWRLLPAWAEDAAGARCPAVTTTLAGEGAHRRLVIGLDEDWLQSPSRAWPVRVDPTLATLQPDRAEGMDSYLASGRDVNYGRSSELRVGFNDYATEDVRYRAVLKLDLASVPKGSSISSAQLHLYMEGNHIDEDATVSVWRLTRSFVEDEVNWVHCKAGCHWATGGGDYDRKESQVTVYHDTAYQWLTFDVTQLVGEWVRREYPNCGVLVRGPSGDDDSWVELTSSDSYTKTQWPRLVVEYTPDTEPPLPIMVSPAPGAELSGQVTVKVESSPDTAQVDLLVDGAVVARAAWGEAGPTSFDLPWDTTAHPDGVHTLQATAVDVADNIGATSEVTVTVSNPVQVSPPAGLAAQAGPGRIELSWNPSATSGVTYNVHRSTTSGFTPAPTNLVAAGLQGTSLADGVNLASNSGFELDSNADGVPDSWVVSASGTPPGGENRFDDSVKRSGSQSHKVYVPSSATLAWYGWQTPRRPIKPNTTYTLSAWLKTQDVTSGSVHVGVHVWDAPGTTMLQTATSNALSGTNDWTLVRGTFTTSAGAATFDFYNTMKAYGTVWTDDVQLEEGSQATPWVDGGLVSGTTYYYLATAVDAGGTASAPSNQAQAAFSAGVGAPSGLVAQAGPGRIELAWTPSATSGVTYNVHRSTASGFAPASTNLVAAGLQGTSLVDGLNLVSNSSFELDSNSDGIPDTWTKAGSVAGAENCLDTAQRVTGLKSHKVSMPPSVTPDWYGVRSPLQPLKAGMTYTVSGWLKGEGLDGSAFLGVHVRDAASTTLQDVHTEGITGTTGWTHVKATFTAVAGATQCDVYHYLKAHGTSWADDVQLEKGSEATSWGDGGLASGTTYYYLATAVDAGGTACAPSNQAQAVFSAGVGAPSGLVAQAGPGRIELSWNPSLTPGVTYSLHRSTTSGFTPAPTNLIAAGVQGTSLEDGLNLVSNSGFELDSNSDGIPDSWVVSAGTPPAGENRFDASVKRSGSQSHKVYVPTSAVLAWYGWQTPRRPIKPDTTYTLSAWLKTQDVASGSVHVGVHVWDAPGTTMLQTATSNALSGTNDWTLVRGTFTTPAAAATFDFYNTMKAYGTVWADNVQFEEGSQATSGVDGGLASGATYYYLATAVDAGGTASAPSSQAQAVFSAGVGAPSGLVAQPGPGRIELSWNPSLTPGVTYSLHRSTTSGFAPASTNLIAAGLQGTSLADGVNLVSNSGFEVDSNSDGIPDTWTKAGTLAGAENRLDTSQKVTGLNSHKVSIPLNVTPDWYGMRSTLKPLKAGMTYTVSGWLKGEGLDGPAFLGVHVRDAASTTIQDVHTEGITGTTGWTYVKATFAAVAGATQCDVYHYLKAHGTTWADDVQLQEGSEATPWVDGGLASGTTYYYLATAVDAGGTASAPSNQAQAAFSAGVGAPSGLAAQPTVGRIELAWNPSLTPGVTYSLHRSTTSGFTPASTNLIAAGVQGTSLVDGLNLVSNSSFELDSNSDGIPDTWTKAGALAGAENCLDSTHGMTGPNSHRVTIPLDITPAWYGVRSPLQPIKAGMTYTVSGWLKGEGLDGSSFLGVHVRDAASATTQDVHTEGITGTTGWTYVKATFTAVAGATQCDVYHYLKVHGTSWADDVQLQEGSQATPWVDGGLASGTTYYYLATAVDAGGTASAPSNQTQAAFSAGVGAPSGLSAQPQTGCAIELSWRASATAGVTYRVFRSPAPGLEPSPATMVASGVGPTGYTDAAGLVGGTVYYYKVAAVDGAGVESAPSNEARAVPGEGTPGALAAEAQAGGRVALAWQAPSVAVDHYHAYRSTTAGFAPAGPYLVADGVACTSLLDGLNLVGNSGFESDTDSDGLCDGWSGVATPAGGSNAAVTAEHSGGRASHYLRVPAGCPAGWYGWASGEHPVKPNTTYTLSARVKTCQVADGSVGVRVRVKDATGAVALEATAGALAGTNDWTAVSATFTTPAGAARVDIYNCMAAHGEAWFDDIQLEPGSSAAGWVDGGLEDGLRYRYRVTAVSASGVESGPSDEASALYAATVAAPWQLEAASRDGGRIALAWAPSATPGAVYNVYRSAAKGFVPGPSSRVASGVAATWYLDQTGLVDGTTYFYRASASAEGLESPASNEASAACVAGLAAPTGVVAEALGGGRIGLAWDGSGTSGVTYNIYRSATSGFTPGPENLIAWGVAAASLADGANLAANSSFELDSSGDGIPDGWEVAGSTPSGGENRLDGWQSASGLLSHKTCTPPEAVLAWYGVRTAQFPIKAGATYTLSGRLRVEALDGPAFLGVHVRDAAWVTLLDVHTQTLTGTTGWVSVQATFVAPAGAVQCDAYHYLKAHGTSWADDVQLEEGGAATPWVDGGLAEGRAYYYRVRARCGGVEGPASGQAGAVCRRTRALGLEDRWSYLPLSLPGGGGYLNLAWGNLVVMATDSVIPAPRLAAVVRRVYNSGSRALGALGRGWSLGSDFALVEEAWGAVRLREGDGGEHVFSPDGSGGYTREPGAYLTLGRNLDGTWELERKDGVSFHFSAAGRLERVTEPNGNRLSYAYAEQGQLAAVTDPVGRVTRLTYTSGVRLGEVQDGAGRRFRYGYDLAGNLCSVTGPDGATVTYEYDEGGAALVGVVDALGHRVGLEYDGAGRLVALVDPLGAVTRIAYDAGRGTTTVTDALGHSTAYAFDAEGTLLHQTDALGRRTEYEHDADFNLTRLTDPAGRVARFTYDAWGNLLTLTDPAGGVRAFTYDAENHPTSETDPLGRQTRWEYDSRGNLAREVDPLGQAMAYTCDSRGDRLTATDPLGRTTRYAYDSLGNLESVTDPLGARTTYAYDAAGNVICEVGPSNLTTYYEYDAVGRLLRTVHPDGTSERRAYDAAGNLVSLTDEGGHRTTYGYDACGRRVWVEGPLGRLESSGYDAAGNLAWTRDAHGHATTRVYDALNRPVRENDPLGNSTGYSYDAAGRNVAVTDALGRTWSAAYDALDRLVGVTDPLGQTTRYFYDACGNLTGFEDALGHRASYTFDRDDRLVEVRDALGGRTAYGYDAVGNRTSMVDALGRTTRWEYDACGRVLRQALPLGNATSYGYDPTGNCVRQVDARGQATAYTYDSRDRLASVAYADAQAVRFQHAPEGLVLRMDDSRGATFYQYDAMDRLVRVVEPQGWATSHTYDLAGCRLSLNCAWGTVSYGYDACDRLASMSDPQGTATYAYDGVGNLKTVTFPGGEQESYGYDACGRLLSVKDQDEGTELIGLDYAYDELGNRLSMLRKEGGSTKQSASYTYDALGRLTGARRSGWSPVTYTYDAVGNRVRMENTSGHSYSFTYDSNDRLTSAQGSWYDWPASMAFAYDANGNRTQKGEGTKATTYLYDAADRLRRITLPDAATVCYNYSGDGRRVYYKDKDRAYYHQYDGEQVVADLDGTGVAVAFYGRTPGGRLAYSVQKNLTYRYHQDALGSVVLMTSAGGHAVAGYEYDEYGVVAEEWADSGLDNRFKYVGVGLDTGPGLYAMPARYYDPQVGRFLSRDSWQGDGWQPWTRNLYAYARDNPVNYVDPSGMREVWEAGLGAGVSAGAAASRVMSAWRAVAQVPVTGPFLAAVFGRDPVTGRRWVDIGREVHEIVEEDFMGGGGPTGVGTRQAEYPTPSGNRVDMVLMGAVSYEIYELKPSGDRAWGSGRRQIRGYLGEFARAGAVARAGTSYAGSGRVLPYPSDPAGRSIELQANYTMEPGMVYYTLTRDPKAQPQPVPSLRSTVMSAAVGAAMLLSAWARGLTPSPAVP